MTVETIEGLAAALGIGLRPEWRHAVMSNLEVSLRLGAEVAAFPLDDEWEMAPVFVA